jgi:hypothetical protein
MFCDQRAVGRHVWGQVSETEGSEKKGASFRTGSRGLVHFKRMVTSPLEEGRQIYEKRGYMLDRV